jgi:small redox-active disulfide protein 2
MEIKILGGGCPKCKRLEVLARQAVDELGLTADFIKVKDMADIMAYDVMTTPALVIDEVVKCSGRIPTIEEIKGWLQTP